jgi:2-(1,2-epoxy-1,2-dihydrophenyl)acetyl-CoA isomerase
VETGSTTYAAPAILSTADGIATITLNRPEALNALNAAMVTRLHALAAEVETDETIRAVVIRGAGAAFMAGGDVRQFMRILQSAKPVDEPDVEGATDYGADAAIEGRSDAETAFCGLLEQVNSIVLTLRRMHKPVLAVVDGPAAGFGVSLALACDMVLASEAASFTPAYAGIGATPDGGITRHLPLAIGRQAAFQLLTLGDHLDAQAAKELGLVNKVVSIDRLDAEVEILAGRLAKLPTAAIGRTKALLNAATDGPLGERLAAESSAFLEATRTDDFREGVTAFVEKRKPIFTGT